MRISILALFLTLNGIILANRSDGQDLSRIMISIDIKDVSLKTALRKLEAAAHLPVSYRSDDIAGFGRISISYASISVEKLLDELLGNTGLQYELVNNNIIIKKGRNELVPANVTVISVADGGVRGKVTNQSGEPIPNVSVLLLETDKGTAANDQGEFSLTGIKPGTYRLQISAIGYTTVIRQITVHDNGMTDFNVQLITGQEGMSEVVVTALGIRRSEKSLGYSTQAVKGENLTFTKEQNVIGSLAGKIAGVQVVGSSGASMGGTQKIKIRGVNSLTGSGEPLIVVDGTPISNDNFAGRNGGDYGNLGQDINPEDVESVNVLKGPTASALYGIRGQYGVIMITTKKGSKGAKKVNVQLNSAFSIEKVGNFLPLQDVYGGGSSQTWRTLANGDKYVDMSIDESWGPKMDGTPVRAVFSFYPQDPTYGQLTPFVPQPDNIKDFFETGNTLNNGISISGGGENSTFRLSFNDTRINGVEPNTWLRRNNLGVSASLDLTKKLTVSTNFTYATNNGRRPSQGYDGGSRYLVQWFQRNVDMKRLKDYKYDDGTFVHWNLNRPTTAGEITDFRPLYWNNPYFEAYENRNSDDRDRFFGDVGLTYKIIPGLKVSGFVRGDMYTQNIETREAFESRYIPFYSIAKYQNKETNYEFLAEYNKELGDFSIAANVGGNIYKRRYTSIYQASNGGLSTPGYYNIAASVDRPDNTNYLLRKEIRSLYGMVSLGYKGTYFIDASLRNDNSSALPKANNSYWYPSISGSFVFSELVPSNVLSFGKLRLSYAQAGSDLPVYQVSPVYGVGGIYNGINTLYVPDNLLNPNIKPSFAHSYEAGVDLKFFANRLGIDFTLYEQKNKNQIINLGVSGTSGYSTTLINAGLIQNKGIEIALSGKPVATRNFSWDALFNLSRNRSKVVELGPGQDVYNLDENRYSGVSVYLKSFVGKPFGSLIGKAYLRDEATGKILLNNNNLPMYTEATHDFGTVLPDYTGGFQNIFRLFGFDIALMIDYQMGGQFFSWSQMLAVKTGMAERTAAINANGKNVREPVADGGGVLVNGISNSTKEEVSVYVEARPYYRTTLGTHVYEEWLYDASYIKLREARLGYTFGKEKLGKLPFKSVSLALIARNPWMIWQKAPKGIDPSELSTGGSPISWLETGTLNTVRSFGVNLNVNF